MRSTAKTFAMLILFGIFATFVPQGAFAAKSCIDEYMLCINNTYNLKEPYRTMADIECGAGYTGCVANKLKFW